MSISLNWIPVALIWALGQLNPCRWRCLRKRHVSNIYQREELVDGCSLKQVEGKTICCIGAGGIGGEVAEGFVRGGYGKVVLVDGDSIEWSNLNRQFFFPWDVGLNKADRLKANLAMHAVGGTNLEAHAEYFDSEDLDYYDSLDADLFVVGVDNEKARYEVSEYCKKKGIPAIFLAIDLEAEAYRVTVQAVDGPSYVEMFPNEDLAATYPCGVAACKAPVKAGAGMVLFAASSILQKRRIAWNHRLEHCAGFGDPITEKITPVEKGDE